MMHGWCFDNCVELAGAIFDPPYSPRQVKEMYNGIGLKPDGHETSAAFYSEVLDLLSPMVKIGGYAIRCGWSTMCFGINRGFELIEILAVPHGGAHADTLVTVERKIE